MGQQVQVVRRGMRQGQVTARGQRVAEGGQDAVRVLPVGDEVHDRHQQQGDGLAEVDECTDLGVGQDGLGFAQAGQDDAGGPAVGQQRVGVHVHDRVVVDVDHLRLRARLKRDLVGVATVGSPAPTSMISRIPASPAR